MPDISRNGIEGRVIDIVGRLVGIILILPLRYRFPFIGSGSKIGIQYQRVSTAQGCIPKSSCLSPGSAQSWYPLLPTNLYLTLQMPNTFPGLRIVIKESTLNAVIHRIIDIEPPWFPTNRPWLPATCAVSVKLPWDITGIRSEAEHGAA